MMPEREISPEIPLPSSKIILIDLDKTLLGQGYEINSDDIFTEITRVQNLGWHIDLSSDTPLEPLLVWKKRFGMNGPIVAEKGSVIKIGNEPESVMEEAQNFFFNIKKGLANYLIDYKVPFFFGDVTQFVRNQPQLQEMVDNRIILLQAYRRCSINFYGKKIDNYGQLQIDNPLTLGLVEQARKLIANSAPFELEEDFNPDYGIYILGPKLINKRLGSMRLLVTLGINRIGMIGDSQADFLGSDISFHYSVGNAKPELKLKSDYVASNEYTKGVVEILKLIKN